MMRTVALWLLLAAVPIQIPHAQYAFDRGGPWIAADRFAYPGVASPLRPLMLWVRFPAPATGTWFLVGAPGVGYAQLFAPGKPPQRFGTRVPFSDRTIARVPPTVAVPNDARGSYDYVQLALDDESRLAPLLELKDAAAVASDDAALSRMAQIALLFMGMFLSLAAANVFVYAFVRERAYVIYSILMVSNALFAACYVHGSAWEWFWPGAAVPDVAVQGTVLIVEAIALLAFARSFLQTRRYTPRFDRIVVVSCGLLIALAAWFCYVAPSANVAPGIDGRSVFLISCVGFVGLVFALGIAVLRPGNQAARFFVASNVIFTLTAIGIAAVNFSRHDVTTTANFVALMSAQAIEGWLLFGALAYRLRVVMGAHADEQQRRLVAQAEMLAQAQALLEQQRLATTDALTGIGNRRRFDEMLELEWHRAARTGAPLSLLLIDVDHFKRYNDLYGHVAGDECLRRVAEALRTLAKRPTDVCARYGGEEFALILAETPLSGAVAVAEQAVAAVRDMRIEHGASEHGCVTISAGVASALPEEAYDPAPLVDAADEALYAAKRQGRDRAVAAYDFAV